MSKKSEHSFSSVVSINPYTQEYYTSVSSFLTKARDVSYKKEQYAISFLNTKGFIHSQIGISKNIPKEDVYDAVYSKAYDELALDQAIEYNIQIVEHFSNVDDENRYFHLFIVDPTELDETFKASVEKVKYIDQILPAPLFYKTLYTKEIVETSGCDCFVYIQENDASITIYNEKEFLYTKSLKFSLEEMHERFCEIYGERIPYDEFTTFLSTANLKYTESDYRESLLKLYKELFTTVNDVLTYAKRAFELDKIDVIYIGASIYFESKLDEMLESELSIKSKVFDFDYGLESNEDYVDQMHMLMHLYTTIPDEEKYLANFTMYPRPPKFTQRESGKLIMVTAASLFLAFLYPLTYWTLAYIQQIEINVLEDKYSEIHNIRVTREATIKNKQAELNRELTLLKEEKDEFASKKATLKKIKRVKNGYLMKAKTLTMFTKDLNKFNVKVESLKYDENNNTRTFTFNLVAPKSEWITKLLEHVTKVHEEDYRFELEKITYDKDSKVYFSTLKAIKL